MKNSPIPIWITALQIILTLIMLQQVYIFYLDHAAVAASGIMIEGTSNQNLLFEFAGRTVTMVIASIFVLITQNPRYFLVILLMNIFREAQETVIDPLFPLLNAPATPMVDLIIHIVIVAIEIWAFVTMYKIVKAMDKNGAT